MPTANRIFIRLQLSPRQQRGNSGFAFILLLTALGLSVYLTVTHTWFLFLVPTTLTLFFAAFPLVVLSVTGWRGIWFPPNLTDAEPAKFRTVVLVFLAGLCIFFESPFLNVREVFERLPQLEAYNADPVCSASMMYELARTTPESAPAGASYPARSVGVCEVKWDQAIIDGRPIASYPYSWWASYQTSRHVRKEDLVVAQTAFGRVSAVLYPSTALEDRILSPRGVILPTGDNPVLKFEDAFMWNFWILLFLTFTGAAIMWRLWASFRNLPESLS